MFVKAMNATFHIEAEVQNQPIAVRPIVPLKGQKMNHHASDGPQQTGVPIESMPGL